MILTSNQNEISGNIFDNNEPFEGYVDMLAVTGNDYKPAKDKGLEQLAPASEDVALIGQSKKKAIRRINFKDTDKNNEDSEIIDYSVRDKVLAYYPRSVADGAWDEKNIVLAEIEIEKNKLPKFYEEYCTAETATKIKAILTKLENDLAGDNPNLETIRDNLKTSIETLKPEIVFKSDESEKTPRVYVVTQDENGAPYGIDETTKAHKLTKAIGYVPAQLTVVSADGTIISSDLSWNSKIKVRGNSSSYGAKRPYNMKFAEGVNLFEFGKAKKWVLLADFNEPTLMRNRIAFQLGKDIELDATMDTQRIEVWVDGEYRGLYLLTEKIEEDENRVAIDSKNGDFLIEMERDFRIEEEQKIHNEDNIYFRTDLGTYFRLHEPEDETKVEEIKAKINELEQKLASGIWDEISNIIDIDSFVRYGLLNDYLKTLDFYNPLSVYFYYRDGKFYGGPTWDHDGSAGNVYRTITDGYQINSIDGEYLRYCNYFSYLINIPEFQYAFFRELLRIKNHSFFENIYQNGGFIDKDRAYYSSAIKNNNDYWGRTETNYDGQVKFLKSWLESRDIWLQDYFFNRIYKEEDGKYYSYVNGEHRQEAAIFKLDDKLYFAQNGGKIATGFFDFENEHY
ncbi:MAG: CotH kinase family protein, partial [Synergistaceae bacterium]|nr:CotH kinase family protein [Synergistaceae bacterium]